MIAASEYEHHQKYNRFHSSAFYFCYSIFISNEGSKKGDKEICFHLLFFELYFEHMRVLKCVFN